MEEVIVRYINLPCTVRGFVREDPDGNYNIYINARLSYDMQQETIEHELRHVRNRDFSNDLSIAEIENF